jgi:hypothetical protein
MKVINSIDYQFRRSFGVGWGPNGQLAIPRSQPFTQRKENEMEVINSVNKEKNQSNNTMITLTKLVVDSNSHVTIQCNNLAETNIEDCKKQKFLNEVF